MQEESKRARSNKRRAALELERSSYVPVWQDIERYIAPGTARFYTSDANKGGRRDQKIYNNKAGFSLSVARSGLHAGITSPARPWFQLRTADESLNDYGPVKTWLYTVEQRMRELFLRSNLYQVLPLIYRDLCAYGTSAAALMEDDQDTIRLYHFPVGSYMLANSERLTVDTCIREYRMTVRQLVQRFGLDNVSDNVKTAYESGHFEKWVDVVHEVCPNEDYDPRRLESRFKRFRSCYYEKASNEDKYLSEAGFDEFPILAPRWDTTGEDVYGDSPGKQALGDVKQLQLEEKRKAEAIDKHVRPPMVGPSSLKTSRASILSGDITYVDVNQGQQGFQPAYTVKPEIAGLMNDIKEIEYRISRHFYEDLFLMLTNDARAQPPTAEEIRARQQEKMLMLGPVLERVNQELLDRLIARTFGIMLRQSEARWNAGMEGIIPQPPEELASADVPLNVEYISIMAQAQKLIGTTNVERFASFVGNLAAVRQDALDRLNVDEAVDTYADMTGVPPKLLVPIDEANKIRQARAEKQQAMEQAQAMMTGAQGAELLSKADMSGDNALNRLLAGVGAGPV